MRRSGVRGRSRKRRQHILWYRLSFRLRPVIVKIGKKIIDCRGPAADPIAVRDIVPSRLPVDGRTHSDKSVAGVRSVVHPVDATEQR